MIKGYYKTKVAIPCYEEDMHLFRKMMKNMEVPQTYNVFVKRVNFGDIVISRTVIQKWKIISENGKMYLGFYEKPLQEMHYQGIECPLSYYAVIKDYRKNSQQKHMLCRIPKWMAFEVFNFKK